MGTDEGMVKKKKRSFGEASYEIIILMKDKESGPTGTTPETVGM